MDAIASTPPLAGQPMGDGAPRPLQHPGRHLPCPLPEPRGPVTSFLVEHLVRAPHDLPVWPAPTDDPLTGDDTHLALYLVYELNYRGVEGVDERWEWHPDLIRLRGQLEDRFEAALVELVGDLPEVDDVTVFLQELTTDDGDGRSISKFIEHEGDLQQFREQAVHRTAWQLKEADPHSWAIPRLGGKPKAALVEIQADEYGDGVDQDVHAELYALTMERLGLSSRPNHYIDLLPGITLATVNLVSMFGLHRRWLGAVIGHLAVFEMSSVTTMARFATALRRLHFDPWTCLFFDTHVVADAHHQTVAATDLAGGLVEQEPRRLQEVVFGALALCKLEGKLTERVLDAWDRGESSLLGELGVTGPAPGQDILHVPADDPRVRAGA
ncbi:iron-containing redox enzyme family protein [Egicoccus sp. AB-alg6-2]|uniref:iron-containing redox enzyme family protein n=1 Tax=Egicoccus sp. AB-alg6-2 TaxID=3242692 RepID=UPI00359E6168